MPIDKKKGGRCLFEQAVLELICLVGRILKAKSSLGKFSLKKRGQVNDWNSFLIGKIHDQLLKSEDAVNRNPRRF